MTKISSRYSSGVQARAARLVLEHVAGYPSQRSAIEAIASKIGCTAETLRPWVRREDGMPAGGPGRPATSLRV